MPYKKNVKEPRERKNGKEMEEPSTLLAKWARDVAPNAELQLGVSVNARRSDKNPLHTSAAFYIN